MAENKFNSIKGFFNEIQNNYEKQYLMDSKNSNYLDKSGVLNNNWYYTQELKKTIVKLLNPNESNFKFKDLHVSIGCDNRQPRPQNLNKIAIVIIPRKHTLRCGVYLIIRKNKNNKIEIIFTYANDTSPPEKIKNWIDELNNKYGVTLDLNKNELDKIVKEKVNKFQEIAKINNFPNMKSGRGKIWNVNYDISSLTSSINDNIKTSFLEILELWKNVLLKQEEGVHFNTKKEYKKRPNSKLVDRFLKDPTDENFKAFWDLLYASKQKSQSIHVLNNNEMSKIVSFIGKLRSNPKIDDKWLKQNKINNAYGTVLELHGLLNIETSPIINGCTKEALKVLGFKAKPDKYDIWLESFGEFKKVYEGEIGYVTNETNYKIPINYEIDKLFNVIDKVKLRDIEKAQSNEEKKLYQKVIKLKEQKLSSQIIEDKPKSDIQIPINTPANFILYGPPRTGKT